MAARGIAERNAAMVSSWIHRAQTRSENASRCGVPGWHRRVVGRMAVPGFTISWLEGCNLECGAVGGRAYVAGIGEWLLQR